MSDTSDDRRPKPAHLGPRRRTEERIAFRAPLRAKCSTWPSFHDLFSGNVSNAGIFIATDEPAAVGDNVSIALYAPDGETLDLGGIVRHIFRADDEQRGLGVQLVEVKEHNRERYETLVQRAAEIMRVEAQDSDFDIPIFEDGNAERAASAPQTTAEPSAPSAMPALDEPPTLIDAPPEPDQPAPEESFADLNIALEDEEEDVDDALDAELDSLFDEEPAPADTPAVDKRPAAAAKKPPSTRDDGSKSRDEPEALEEVDVDLELELDLDDDDEPVAATPPPPPPTPEAAAPPPTPGDAHTSSPPPPPVAVPSPTGIPHLVAIDFGTSRSSVAAIVGNEARVLRLDDDHWDIPSVVGFLDSGEVVLGRAARDLLAKDPSRAISSPKRLLGRRYDDPEIQPYLQSLAVPVSRGRDGGVLIHAGGKSYSIEQVCAPIIYHLKQTAEQRLRQPVKEAVLTTPVSFSESRYRALRHAAQLAGIRVRQFVDEPTAAALTHRFDESFRGCVAVYDFGGGTFDFSVVDVSSADLQVVATAGDTWLGGDDFDEALANAAANSFWREHHIEVRHQVVQWQRLLVAAERSKRQLSTEERSVVEVGDVALSTDGPLHLRLEVARPQFALMAAPVIQRSIDTCMQALELSDLSPSELNAVYLSGGTSYIPAVREAVARYFGRAPRAAVPPERAVVIGAAMYAALLETSRIQV